jgi:hypothetical protein
MSAQAFDTVFGTKYGVVDFSSTNYRETITLPSTGSSASELIAAGVSQNLSNKSVDDAAKLISVYYATLTETGSPQAQHVDVYNTINCYFVDRAAAMTVGSEISDTAVAGGVSNDGLDELRKRYQREKNLLQTLVSKNKNINRRYARSNMFTILMLTMLVVYSVVMGALIMNMGNLSPQLNSMVKITLSSVVLMGILMTSLYKMITSSTFEGFATGPVCNVFTADMWDEAGVFTGSESVRQVLITSLETYLSTIKTLDDYNELTKGAQTNEQQKLITAILTDYDNVNYLNMRRYQSTDYKLERSRYQQRFIQYGFVIVSIIGLLSSTLTKEGPMSGLFVSISSGLVLFYLIAFLLYSKQNMVRKKYNWNKLYWNVENLKKTN